MAAAFYKRLPGLDDNQCGDTDCGSCMEACESKSRAKDAELARLAGPGGGLKRQPYFPPCLAGALRMERIEWSGQLSGEWQL